MFSVYPKPLPSGGKKLSCSRPGHKQTRLAALLCWLTIYLTIAPALSQAGVLDDPAIQWTLQIVETSPCLFIRNGATHNGREAAAHMRKKARHFAKKIHSVDDFIRYAASKSLLTGQAYRVRCPNQPERTSAEWLLEKQKPPHKTSDKTLIESRKYSGP